MANKESGTIRNQATKTGIKASDNISKKKRNKRTNVTKKPRYVGM